MPAFTVQFHKELVGDAGRVCDTCQGSIDVTASSEDQAARLAMQKFCDQHSIRDWTLYADRFEVRPAN